MVTGPGSGLGHDPGTVRRTSFSVEVTDLFLQSGVGSGKPIYTIDPAGGPLPYLGLGPPAVQVLQAKAEELLPAVCERLGIAPE